MAVEYARAKQDTTNLLKKLEQLSANQGSNVLAAYLGEQREKLAGDKFHMVVLGQFKGIISPDG